MLARLLPAVPALFILALLIAAYPADAPVLAAIGVLILQDTFRNR